MHDYLVLGCCPRWETPKKAGVAFTCQEAAPPPTAWPLPAWAPIPVHVCHVQCVFSFLTARERGSSLTCKPCIYGIYELTEQNSGPKRGGWGSMPGGASKLPADKILPRIVSDRSSA